MKILDLFVQYLLLYWAVVVSIVLDLRGLSAWYMQYVLNIIHAVMFQRIVPQQHRFNKPCRPVVQTQE